MAPKYNINNPGQAAQSIERWFPEMFGIAITARQVQAYWVYTDEFQEQQRARGQPFTNLTATVKQPSQVAIDCANFLTAKGVPVEPEQIQAFWLHHKEWQTSPQRRAERIKQPAPDAGLYVIINQRELKVGEEQQYEGVEGEKYSWTSTSSGAWKQLSVSTGARFVYYRPGTAADGTGQTYFGSGVIETVDEPTPGAFVGRVTDYAAFERPVPNSEGPRINHQTSIQPIAKEDFERLVRLGGQSAGDGELTLDEVRDAATKAGLKIDDSIYVQLLAALTADKHVILTGPPGTAKTTLAQAVADAATRAGLCAGFLPTTATADWTTFDTIGGLRPKGANTLEFEEGHFLEAIRKNQWLLIDELNRSQFDRAFGQLFTVLSGQPVVLPHERPGTNKKLVLLPAGAESPIPDGDILQIPESWRIIATMNVFDKSLLFEMSFALMRRFAFIEVASPSSSIFEELIDLDAKEVAKAAELAKQLLVLRAIKDLGPAVFIDVTKFLRERISLGAADDGQLLFEGFYSYLLPQFEGIDVATGDQLFKTVSKMMGSAARKDRLRTTLNDVLGLELVSPAVQHQDHIDIGFGDDVNDAEEFGRP